MCELLCLHLTALFSHLETVLAWWSLGKVVLSEGLSSSVLLIPSTLPLAPLGYRASGS